MIRSQSQPGVDEGDLRAHHVDNGGLLGSVERRFQRFAGAELATRLAKLFQRFAHRNQVAVLVGSGHDQRTTRPFAELTKAGM